MGQSTDENIKVLLYTSVVTDGGKAYSIDWDKWRSVLKNNYEHFTFKSSNWDTLFLPDKENIEYYKYQIKIYKLPNDNSESQDRYLLHYKDISSNVRLRLAGYVENDMKVLFKYLESKSINKKQLKKLIKDWANLNDLFSEVNLDCILEGYFKNSTKSDCFKAVYYIEVNDFTIGNVPLEKNELNSCFSRIPLYGYFKESGDEY
jgi:hypothetical protein